MREFILLLVAAVVLTISSCSDNNSSVIDGEFTQEELDKIKLVQEMFIEHGWELDSTVSQQERNRMIKDVDIEEIRLFLDQFCY